MRRFVLLLTAFVAGGAFSKRPDPAPFVLYGSNRQGETEPCGCPVEQLGGLRRLAVAKKQWPIASTLYVEAGDLYFPSQSLYQGERAEDQRRKAKLIAASMRKLGLAAFTPSTWDFAAGREFLDALAKSSGAPMVIANASFGLRFVVVERGKQKFGITGLLDGPTGEPPVILEDAKESLAGAFAAMREQGATTGIVLSAMGVGALKKLVPDAFSAAKIRPDRVLVVAARSAAALDEPMQLAENIWLVEPEPGGKTIGTFRFPVHEVVKLNRDFDGVSSLDGLFAAYRKEQRVVAEATVKAAPAKDPAKWVANAHRCAGCHTAQYDFWKKTKHASAYLVLYSTGAHVDPECIRCHSIAFEEPGGFAHVLDAIEPTATTPKKPALIELLLKKTFAEETKSKRLKELDSRKDPKRFETLAKRYHAELDGLVKQGKVERVWAGVQCEHCHGNRLQHVSEGPKSAPPTGPVAMTACLQCHTPERDSDFNFVKDRPLVACPKIVR